MQTSDDELVILITTPDRRLSAELALVMEARGIEVVEQRIGRLWAVRVARGRFAEAAAELDAYARENPPLRRPSRVATSMPGHAWPGAVAYVAVIVGMVIPVSSFLFGRDWTRVGRIDSAAIFAGEWWRPVTALTLHADAAHLLGNAGFGAFFGVSLARTLGNGFAWLVILLSGVIGNVLNAWLAGPDHRALGASTAVFGALGILTSYSWRTGFADYRSWRQRIAPVIAGIGLLAFTGTGGENTDIGAHLMGFLAGFAIGAAVASYGWPTSRRQQNYCGLATVAILVCAWGAALLS